MRKALYILALCIASTATSFAQTTIFSSQQFLTENKTYFFNAEVEDKTLILYAISDSYDALDLEQKETMMNTSLRSAEIDLVMVYSKYTRELWSRSTNTKLLGLIDTWNMNDMEIDKFASKQLKGTPYHPFFFSGSFGLSSINFKTTTMSMGVSAGCYLVKQILDASVHASLNGDIRSVGLSSRVHIPIKSAHMSPFVGIGIERSAYDVPAISSYEDSTVATNTFPLYLGMSFFVGNGSIDGTYSYDKNSKGQFTIGYTIMVRYKN